MSYTIKFKDGSSKKFNTLRGANVRDADLSDANLRGADLYEANLREADLRRADLRGADLRRTNLRGADLRGADLRGANLSRADLRGAYLYEADLYGANLSFTKGVLSVTFGQHLSYAFKYGNNVYIKTGCITKDIEYWYKNYRMIGIKNKYSENQIHMFKIFMLMVKEFDFNA